MFNNETTLLITATTIAALWEVTWKGIGLWHAAQARHKVWFIAILILNTIGVLPIIYLLIQRNASKKLPTTPVSTSEMSSQQIRPNNQSENATPKGQV